MSIAATAFFGTKFLKSARSTYLVKIMGTSALRRAIIRLLTGNTVFQFGDIHAALVHRAFVVEEGVLHINDGNGHLGP